ncbi:hypothetical protein T09_2980 [Trichinella sp. T9]|nr:hypothetical protein T09_2980 [Trichinella sp. T9]
MDIGRARQPYTTLNALWNEWTSAIGWTSLHVQLHNSE